MLIKAVNFYSLMTRNSSNVVVSDALEIKHLTIDISNTDIISDLLDHFHRRNVKLCYEYAQDLKFFWRIQYQVV